VQDYDTSTPGLGYLPLPEAGSRAVASYWATTFQTLD